MSPQSTSRLTAVLVGSSMYHASYWLMFRGYKITRQFPLAGFDPDGNPFQAFRCYKPSDCMNFQGLNFGKVVEIDGPEFTTVREALQRLRN